MSLANQYAIEISGDLKKSHQVFVMQDAIEFDPFTISIIMSIIYNAFRLYQACGYQPVGIRSSLNNQSWLMQFQMRRLMRSECRGKPHATRRLLRDELEKKLLEKCAVISQSEVEQLCEEAQAS